MSIFEITVGNSAPPASLWMTILTGLAVALGGGIVLFGLNWWREHLTAKWSKRSEAEALAFTISAEIDQFINKSQEVVARGYYFNDNNELVDRSGSAKISFSDALNWTVFDKKLQHRIRSLPNEVSVAGAILDKSWDDGEGYLLDVVQEREELFAELGLKALEINDILHKEYGVPLLDRKTIDPSATFKESLKTFADARERQTERRTAQQLVDLTKFLQPLSIEELKVRSASLAEAIRNAHDRRKPFVGDAF